MTDMKFQTGLSLSFVSVYIKKSCWDGQKTVVCNSLMLVHFENKYDSEKLLLTGTLNTLDYTTCRFLRGNQYYLQISYVIDYRRNFLTKQSESILYDTNVCFKRIKRWKKV